jgi:hypothetical protein
LDAGGWVWTASFDPTGQRFGVAATGGRIWDIPEVPVPVPAWFPGFAEAIAGIRLSERGNVELVPRSELNNFAKQLAPAESSGFYARFAQWFLTDPTNRAAAPF